MSGMKIDKNIPVPTKSKKGYWREIAEKMEKGDSVLVNSRNEGACLYHAIRYQGHLAIVRGENKKFRVWRIN